MLFDFDAHICQDFAQSTRREWLETNGIGGFASSTICGNHTRRYHGLLIASLQPPTHRFVLLSKFEETLIIKRTNDAAEENNFAANTLSAAPSSVDVSLPETTSRISFSTNTYQPNVVYPNGFALQTRFRLDPFPVSTFKFGDIEIEKKVLMLHGSNTTIIRYGVLTRLPPQVSLELELRPLFALRDYHSLQRASFNGNAATPLFRIEDECSFCVATHDASLNCFIAHTKPQAVSVSADWYKQFEYAREQERGFDFHEDLFNPYVMTFAFSPAETVDVIASTERNEIANVKSFEASEVARRACEVDLCASNDKAVCALWTASANYIVRRTADSLDEKNLQPKSAEPVELQTVIAGYHWFTDWGRDTMIALPGLTLATRRFDKAREILLAFAAYFNCGLIPNNFPDRGGKPSYNTVDATLWYFHAANDYLRRTNDDELLRRLYPHLVNSLTWHELGTHNEIRMDEDGLLRAGNETTQLTWMDAKVGDYVVTPRSGRAVEIQALWYNALLIVADFAAQMNDAETNAHCCELAAQAKTSFNRLFWNKEKNCLYDVVADSGAPDSSVRPNQIFALSLPHTIVDDEARARAIIEIVERDLLTPYGLRSLAPADKDYHPAYIGDAWARDTAYHQGTVWAWLIGHFITAYLNTNGRNAANIARARQWTQGLREHLLDDGIGHVAEIFDAAAPHAPHGCIAQAWSVAELLRCELEELL